MKKVWIWATQNSFCFVPVCLVIIQWHLQATASRVTQAGYATQLGPPPLHVIGLTLNPGYVVSKQNLFFYLSTIFVFSKVRKLSNITGFFLFWSNFKSTTLKSTQVYHSLCYKSIFRDNGHKTLNLTDCSLYGLNVVYIEQNAFC